MSRRYARRLLKQLDLPGDAPKLLDDSRYWRLAVFSEFARLCEQLHIERPRDGLLLARIAPALVAKIDPEQLRPRLALEAHTLLASAHRAVGELTEAEQVYATARTFLEKVGPLDQAHYYCRFASLRRSQRRLDEARAAIERGIRLYREHGDFADRALYGLLLLSRGTLEYANNDVGGALASYSASLNHLDPRRDQVYYYSALHNLSSAIVTHPTPDDLGVASAYLQRARRRLSYHPEHFARHKMQWLQGLIDIRFGSTRRGEKLLIKAREGLIKLEVPYDVAMISLDLALLSLSEGRLLEVEHLARETYEIFTGLSVDREAQAALDLWRRAQAHEVTAELLERARARLAGFVRVS